MKNDFVFYPNSKNKFVAIPMFFCFIIFILLFIFELVANPLHIDLFWCFMSIIALATCKFLHDTSRVAVVFSDCGILIDGKRIGHCYKKWSELKYATYFRSVKGHSYLALTGSKISYIILKRLVFLPIDSRIEIEDGVVFRTDDFLAEIDVIIREKCAVLDYR